MAVARNSVSATAFQMILQSLSGEASSQILRSEGVPPACSKLDKREPIRRLALQVEQVLARSVVVRLPSAQLAGLDSALDAETKIASLTSTQS